MYGHRASFDFADGAAPRRCRPSHLPRAKTRNLALVPQPPVSCQQKKNPCLHSKVCHHAISIPPPRRFRAGTTRDAALIASPQLQPLLSGQHEVALELGGRHFAMDEVAEAAAHAALAAVEPAARFAEVRHGRQLAVDGSCRVPARVELVARLLGRVFVLEPRVYVANEVCLPRVLACCMLPLSSSSDHTRRILTVIVIVTHDNLLQLAVLAHLAPKVLVERVKVVLQLAGVHLVLGVEGRVLVEVGQEDRLRVRRLDVLARASVTVAACSDFVVE